MHSTRLLNWPVLFFLFVSSPFCYQLSHSLSHFLTPTPTRARSLSLSLNFLFPCGCNQYLRSIFPFSFILRTYLLHMYWVKYLVVAAHVLCVFTMVLLCNVKCFKLPLVALYPYAIVQICLRFCWDASMRPVSHHTRYVPSPRKSVSLLNAYWM